MLVDTNRKRERLAKLYIDLCAKYIARLKKQQTLVKRKIKANQTTELLSQLSSERLSEEDAATFLSRFAKRSLTSIQTLLKNLITYSYLKAKFRTKVNDGLTTSNALGLNQIGRKGEL